MAGGGLRTYHADNKTGDGKVFDGPGRVITLVVANDGAGNGSAVFKAAAAGATLFTVACPQHDTVVVNFGDDAAFPVARGTDFYVDVTNCTVLTIYD
jgi:hypothetical protein